MVPTEILARQHFDSLCKLLAGYGVRIGLFTRSQKMVFQHQETETQNQEKKGIATFSKTKMLEMIKHGEVDIIVGTQAFLSENVEFKKLGLVIVDEQHRFGVDQRRIIKEKGQGVHFLSMTATPIPRSLALMMYGDLDVSIINELPLGRKKIMSRLVEPHNRSAAYDFIRKQVQQGRQVFVVCPLIEETDVLSEKKSVLKEYKKLSEEIFKDLRVGYLHGKMKPLEKEEIMNKFSAHTIDILEFSDGPLDGDDNTYLGIKKRCEIGTFKLNPKEFIDKYNSVFTSEVKLKLYPLIKDQKEEFYVRTFYK
jgi:ATP-dependent DNA helicase RecG